MIFSPCTCLSTGHLLLSAGLEGKCKVWDVNGDRNCKRTYIGHEEGVKAIHFSNDGTEFLSSGYDRYIRLWDLETGQARGTFSNRKMGYDVKFYPNDNNIFLVAASDNKIYQWDVRTGEVCQEYNYHLQPCNTINFFDEGRKFVSTSDDKKILVSFTSRQLNRHVLIFIYVFTMCRYGNMISLCQSNISPSRVCTVCLPSQSVQTRLILLVKAWTTLWWCTSAVTRSNSYGKSYSRATTTPVMRAKLVSAPT